MAQGNLTPRASFDGRFDYSVETRWTLACALLKERVLDLARTEYSLTREQDLR